MKRALIILAALFLPFGWETKNVMGQEKVIIAEIISNLFSADSDCTPKDTCAGLKIGQRLTVQGNINASYGRVLILQIELGGPIQIKEKFVRLEESYIPETVYGDDMRTIEPRVIPKMRTIP